MKKSAFTLIELLIVITIVGVITSITFVSLNATRVKSRDAKRISDIRQLQSALEMYRNDNNSYPSAITAGQALVGEINGQTYMKKVPTAPGNADGSCTTDTYDYAGTYTNYTLSYCLGGAVQNVGPANCQAIPGNPCYTFTCGDNITYGGETYTTLLIGSQCWFGRNLNIGTRVNNAVNQGDFSSGIQKYCYNDLDSNCDIYGGLYQWHMAAGKNQACDALNCTANPTDICCTSFGSGICPSGWHLPTYNDAVALGAYLGGTGIAGGKLKESGTTHWDSPNTGADNSSGFTGLPGGRRNSTGGFASLGNTGDFTSTSYLISSRYHWGLMANSVGMSIGSYDPGAFGWSVRCIKD